MFFGRENKKLASNNDERIPEEVLNARSLKAGWRLNLVDACHS